LSYLLYPNLDYVKFVPIEGFDYASLLCYFMDTSMSKNLGHLVSHVINRRNFISNTVPSLAAADALYRIPKHQDQNQIHIG